MSAQDPPSPDPGPAPQQFTETGGWFAPGVPVLLGGIVAVLGAIGLFSAHPGGAATTVLIVLGVLLVLAAALAFAGLTPVVAGEARVIQLFGRYRGTVRTPGLCWVNSFSRRRRVSVRIRNHETELAKVNDADGNPIEIAAVVVWQVQDTAQALYAVDDFLQFVAIQTETAVRHIATSYPYDSANSDRRSLRDSAEEITAKLSAEITERVESAWVNIIESRLTRLSYAPEIAQTMLRRQQASAVIAARRLIVEGAVGMVEMALTRLDEENVVELDEERKATMVSNLLVVLCSDHATQPVVNTGTLYH